MPARRATMVRMLVLSFVLSAASLAAGPASAFFADSSSGPRACAPHAQRLDVPGLWLGHFSGGRWDRHPNGDRRVAWRSEYQCFFSARACHAWLAGMRREYARFRGYGTCLALRGGGRPMRAVVRAISVRY